MPIYEYECSKCEEPVANLYARASDAPKEIICYCGEPMYKIVSSSSFRLEGGGWAASGYSKGD